MPVAEVKAVLAAPDTDGAQPADRRASRPPRARARRRRARRSASSAPCSSVRRRRSEIEHRTVPPTPAVGIQQTVDRDDILVVVAGGPRASSGPRSRPRVSSRAARAGAYTRARSSSTAVARRQCSSRTDGPVKPVGRVVALTDSRRRSSRSSATDGSPERHRSHLRRARRVRDEARDRRRRPVRENYLTGYIETTDTDEWETEVGWPIFRTGE